MSATSTRTATRNSTRTRARHLRRTFHRLPVSSLLLYFINSNGDPCIFCYRMGVDILSAGRARFSDSLPRPRIPNACSNLFSTFSTRFSTRKN